MKTFEAISVGLSAENFNIQENGSIVFSGLAYSGDSVSRVFGDIAIDLANAKTINKKVNLLWAHDQSAMPVGSATVEISNEIKIISGEIYNSEYIPNSQALSALINKGHALQLSIGVSGNLVDLKKPQEKVINGKKQNILAVLQDITLNEISFVNTPADSKTYIERMNAQFSLNQKIKSKKEFCMGEENNDIDVDALKLKIAKLEADAILKEKEANKKNVAIRFSIFNLSEKEINEISEAGEAIQNQMFLAYEKVHKLNKDALKPNYELSSKDYNKSNDELQNFGIFKFNAETKEFLFLR
jgi:phage head maturation protease